MSNWQLAQRGDKIFAYRNGKWTPEYTFERSGPNKNFKGHGVSLMSVALIREHLEKYDGVRGK